MNIQKFGDSKRLRQNEIIVELSREKYDKVNKNDLVIINDYEYKVIHKYKNTNFVKVRN